jgi:hypothetical protein
MSSVHDCLMITSLPSKVSVKIWLSFLRKTPFLRSLDQTQISFDRHSGNSHSQSVVVIRHHRPVPCLALRAHGRADARCPRRVARANASSKRKCDATHRPRRKRKQNERPNGSQKDSTYLALHPQSPQQLCHSPTPSATRHRRRRRRLGTRRQARCSIPRPPEEPTAAGRGCSASSSREVSIRLLLSISHSLSLARSLSRREVPTVLGINGLCRCIAGISAECGDRVFKFDVEMPDAAALWSSRVLVVVNFVLAPVCGSRSLGSICSIGIGASF